MNIDCLVTVIIPTYNRFLELERAIKSVVNQKYTNLEIIIIDDNVDNDKNSVVENIVFSIDTNIKYVRNTRNMGSAETRNIGIKKATGKYITFLDDDDIYLPMKISNQVEYMEINNLDYSLTNLCLYDENDNLVDVRKREYIESYEYSSLIKYHLMYHMTGTDTLMFKRDYLSKIGGFPPINVGDEFYLMMNAIKSRGNFGYLDICDVKAYIHSETDGVSSGAGKIKGENQLYEFKKTYFYILTNNQIRYIKMRHYAVIAFAEVRRKHYFGFIKTAIISLVCSPYRCLKLLLNLKNVRRKRL